MRNQKRDKKGEGEAIQLRDRLADLWKRGCRKEFYILVVDELAPKVKGYLRKKYSLTVEDAEDCFCSALQGFVERSGRDVAAVEGPETFIWTSARFAAVDLIREHDRLGEAELGDLDPTKIDPAYHEINSQAAVTLIEGLIEDVDADPSWAVRVVQLAIARLRPALRRVALHLLHHAPDCRDPGQTAETAEQLGLKVQTFRASKSLAYDALRELIPAVMDEHGIMPPRQRMVEVLRQRHEFAGPGDPHE